MKNKYEPADWWNEDVLIGVVLFVLIVVSKFYTYLDKIESAITNSFSAWKIIALIGLILGVAIITNVIIYWKIGKRFLREMKDNIP